MLVSLLPPSFLDTYSQSTSSLVCNALCMVISFLVFWSICFSPSLVHFKNAPKYLTRDTAQVFIPLISFMFYSFFSSSFLVLLRYSFLIFFFHLHLFDGVSFQDAQVFVGLLFSERSFSWFGSSIPSVRRRLPLFMTSMAHFSMPDSISMSWLYIPTACIKVSCSFSFLQTVWYRLSTLGDWSFPATY